MTRLSCNENFQFINHNYFTGCYGDSGWIHTFFEFKPVLRLPWYLSFFFFINPNTVFLNAAIQVILITIHLNSYSAELSCVLISKQIHMLAFRSQQLSSSQCLAFPHTWHLCCTWLVEGGVELWPLTALPIYLLFFLSISISDSPPEAAERGSAGLFEASKLRQN